MSWGLAFNWLVAAAVIVPIGWAFWTALRRFGRADWRGFAKWFGVALVVVWVAMFVIGAIDQRHNGSPLDGDPISVGALGATFWLPFIGVPIALVMAIAASHGQRWIHRRRALVTA